MKEVILSSDGEACVYSVPDTAADNLETVCLEFAADWLRHSPHAQKNRVLHDGIVCLRYDVQDFIDYLNRWKYPEQPSALVKRLHCMFYELPEAYSGYPRYNF